MVAWVCLMKTYVCVHDPSVTFSSVCVSSQRSWINDVGGWSSGKTSVLRGDRLSGRHVHKTMSHHTFCSLFPSGGQLRMNRPESFTHSEISDRNIPCRSAKSPSCLVFGPFWSLCSARLCRLYPSTCVNVENTWPAVILQWVPPTEKATWSQCASVLCQMCGSIRNTVMGIYHNLQTPKCLCINEQFTSIQHSNNLYFCSVSCQCCSAMDCAFILCFFNIWTTHLQCSVMNLFGFICYIKYIKHGLKYFCRNPMECTRSS